MSVKHALYQLSVLLQSRVFQEAAYESSLGNWYFALKVNEVFVLILEREDNSYKGKGFVIQHQRARSRRA